MMINIIFSIIKFIFLIILINGCRSSDEENELTRYIQNIKLRQGKPILPLPKFAHISYVFSQNKNWRDPFNPILMVKKNDSTLNKQHQNQILGQFSLDTLKFVGILKQGNKCWALISQPNLVITRIKVGDYIGKDFRRVFAIHDDSLELEELNQVTGQWKRQLTTLKLTIAARS